jgi:hypothetical protein
LGKLRSAYGKYLYRPKNVENINEIEGEVAPSQGGRIPQGRMKAGQRMP